MAVVALLALRCVDGVALEGGAGSGGAGDDGPGAERSRIADALNSEGVAFYDARKYHQAIASFEKALEIDPGNSDVISNLAGSWSGLGVEFLNSGEVKAAERAFEKSLSIQEDFYAHFGLGYIRFMRFEDEPARASLEASIRLRPEFSKAYKVLALILYRQGKERSAFERMEKAVELDEEDPEARAIRDRWRAEAEVVERYKHRESERFRVKHDPDIPENVVTTLVAHLEGSLDSIGYRLGHHGRTRLVVGLFGEGKFQEATGTKHWIGGLFDGQIKIAIDTEDPQSILDRGHIYRALKHELTHALVKDIYPPCPNWLNEGIAQYFELSPVAERGTGRALTAPEAARLRAERAATVREELRRGRAQRIPFARIPARLWEVTNEAEARWTYLQGLGFVEHLVERYHLFRLRLLLEAARDEGSLAQAFASTYGKTLQELEDAFWAEIGATE